MNTLEIPLFEEFPKMARLSREMIITEKIDGTNAQILITESGDIHVGSRTRWLTTNMDNFGFANWVEAHKEEILQLGPGRHYGEWWGNGIQRGYGLPRGEKRFSLFNVTRWALNGSPKNVISVNKDGVEKYQEWLPSVCGLVPLLYRGPFDTFIIDDVINELASGGSKAAPGFGNPEGIVVFHTAANMGFKKTIKKDETPKSLQ